MTETYHQQVVRQLRSAEGELAQLRQRVAELIEERDTARVELAALHEGEEPYDDERTVPTPAQWIWAWNRATPEQRLARADKAIADADHVYQCFMQAWPDRARDAESSIVAVRALHSNDYGLCRECTGSHGVPWPCPTIAAIDGQDSETGTKAEPKLSARYMTPPRQVPACAFCGDVKHEGLTCEQAEQCRKYLRAFWDHAVKQAMAGTDGVKRGPLMAFSNEDAADRLTVNRVGVLREPTDAEVRAQVRDIIGPHFPVQQKAGTCSEWCADGHMYDGACQVDPRHEPDIIGGNGSGPDGWAWRCWGTDTCDGHLSLGHSSAAAARRAYDRHVKREHAEVTP